MNPIDMQKKTHYTELASYDSKTSAELSADYILPDTYPDVKKLLRVTARPVLIDRYISGKRLDFSGAVDYTVIFSADTEDGEAIRCVHFVGEWNSAVNEVDEPGSANIDITPRIASCTARLSNPRKLSIRSVIASDVRITAMKNCAPEIDGAATALEEQALERLTESTVARRSCTFVADPMRISENISLDPTYPQMDEIVTCNPRIYISEAKPILTSGSLNITLEGTLVADCLYKASTDGICFRSFEVKRPITYNISADEYAGKFENTLPDSLTARVTAVPVEINAGIGEDSYGERRVLELDLTADITIRLSGTEEAVLTLDAYSVDRVSECEYSELETSLPSKLYYANFSVGESISREDSGFPENQTLTHADAEINAGSLKIERGRGYLTGTANISCIFTDENGSFSSTDATVPIRFEINLGDIKEPIAYCTDMTVSDIRVRAEKERIYFDFEVSLCLEAREKRTTRVVSSIRLKDEPRHHADSGAVTVCYPQSTDTVWDIAKRYGIPKAALESANPGGGRVLVIPNTTAKSFVV